MPTASLDLASIIAASGWSGATTGNLATSNDVRATGGAAGEFISAELADAPGDFGSLNTVTLKVEARVIGTVSRVKSITLELRDGSDTILETFTTATLTASDAIYSSSAITRADALAAINAWRLRATVLEGGGMADSATVEIDRIWVEIDYAVEVPEIIRIRSEAAGIGETLLDMRELARAGADAMGIGQAVLRPRAVARRRDEAVAIIEAGMVARALSRLRSEMVGLNETTMPIVEAIGEAVVRIVLEAVAMAETLARPRRLVRIRGGLIGIGGAITKVGGAIGAAAAAISGRIRMRARPGSRLSVRPPARMNVPPARR